jgi:mono/diheme cytochrome c family protein
MKRLALIVGIFLFLLVANHDVHARDVKKGKATYEKKCAQCHGMKGEVSEYGMSLMPFPAKDLRTNLLIHKEMWSVIKYGLYRRAMTGVKDEYTDEEIADIIAYIRTLPYTPDLENGKRKFFKICAPCHEKGSKGMKLSHAMNLEESILTKKEMAEVIRFGRHESPMFERRDNMTNVDIADVIGYLLAIRK